MSKIRRVLMTSLFVTALMAVHSLYALEPSPTAAESAQNNRLQHLRYGQALYQYYQDNPLASLEAIALAEYRGINHTEKPHLQLVKGRASLQLGMNETANRILEPLLNDSQPAAVRANAWFWLAKSSFRQGLYDVSQQAADALEDDLLRVHIKPEQWLEIEYQAAFYTVLQQPGTWRKAIDAVPNNSIWHPYLTANAAIALFNQKDYQQASQLFIRAIESAKFVPEPSWIDRSWSVVWPWSESVDSPRQSPEYRERQELLDRLYYSIGQTFVKLNDHAAAFNAFKQIQADSLYAEQGLLAYGWALANEERWGESMPVWQHLMQQGKGLPALQATHALAYGYEQLTDFARAYSMLQTSLLQLESARTSLREMQEMGTQSVFMQTLAEQTAVPVTWPRLHHDLILDLLSGDNQQNTAKQLQNLEQLNNIVDYIKRQQRSLSYLKKLLDERALALESRVAVLSVDEAQEKAQTLEQRLAHLRVQVAQSSEQPNNLASAEQLAQLSRLQRSRVRLQRLNLDGNVKTIDQQAWAKKLTRLEGILGWELQEKQALQQSQYDLSINTAHALYTETESRLAKLKALTANPELLQRTLDAQYQRLSKLSVRFQRELNRTERLKGALIEALESYLLSRMQQRDALLLEQITATRLAMLRMQDASYSRQQQVRETKQ